MKLIISRPYDLRRAPQAENVIHAFTDYDSVNLFTCLSDYFEEIFIERSLVPESFPLNFKQIDDFVKPKIFRRNLSLLLAASNDTHTKLLDPFWQRFQNCSYVIPDPKSKNEKAMETLTRLNRQFIQIHYDDKAALELQKERFNFILGANDWSTEFRNVKNFATKRNIPYACLQEGPQEWDIPINGKYPNKYRNCDLFFAQGASAIRYIHPKYFALSGTPKSDNFTKHPMPEKKKVFINCNFTYNNWEHVRDSWINDITSICKELELDYLISQHPRDTGIIQDPQLVKSSTYSIDKQIKDCSIIVSRFSNVVLEALKFGRHAVYYNPHGEEPKTFMEDPTTGILSLTSFEELKEVLRQHKKDISPNYEDILSSLNYHGGNQDGNSVGRVVKIMDGVLNNKPTGKLAKMLKNL